MTNPAGVAAPVEREFGTVAACAIALVPALVFSIGWAAIQVPIAPVVLLILAGPLLLPGWVAWIALRARSDVAVVLTAVVVSTALPASQFIIAGGSRLERIFYVGLIGLAFLVGIVVAMRIMRGRDSATILAASVAGDVAMILVLLPLLFAVFVIRT